MNPPILAEVRTEFANWQRPDAPGHAAAGHPPSFLCDV